MAEPTLYDRMMNLQDDTEKDKTSFGGTYDFLNTSIKSSNDPVSEDIDRGFFGSLWRHALSSGTIGLTELNDFARTEDWETKDTSERLGAAAGEFVGMFAPFSVLGKGLRGGVAAIKGGTKLAFKEATDAAVSKAGGEAYQQATSRAIKKSIVDNGGTTFFNTPQLFKQFHMGAKFADNAIDMTGGYLSKQLTKEFREAGLTYTDDAINGIVSTFKTGLREGKYINSIEQWIDSGMGIAKMAPGLKKTVARWGSMGISESITLGLYNGISGMSMAGFRGDEFGSAELADGLKHSVALGFAFPAVRGLFSGGGNVTFKDGFRNIWSTFKGADYAKLAKKPNGKRDLQLFIEELTGGKTKNALAGFEYKLADGTFSTATASSESIAKLSADDAVSILNQMRKYTLGTGLKTYGVEWLDDLRKSSGRMLVGAIMNNTGLFYTEGEYSDAWKRLPKSETMAHLAIGAFFTRQRGHWNHNKQLTPRFKDQMRLGNALGMNADGIKATIRHNTDVVDLKRTGAGLADDPVSRKIYETVEESIVQANKVKPLSQRDKVELNSTSERDLDKINHIYNSIKLFKGEETSNLPDFRSLSVKERQDLISNLNGIEILRDNAGNPVYLKDIKMTELLDVVNIRLAAGASEAYINVIKNVSETVRDEAGEKVFPLVDGGEGEKLLVPRISLADSKESRTTMAQFNELITFLGKNGVVDIDTKTVSAEDFYRNPENVKLLDNLFQKTTQSLVESAYGPGQHVPSFDMFNSTNALLSNITKGKNVEALRLLHDIDTGNIKNLNPSQERLVQKLETIFKGEDGKIIGNFKQISENLLKDSLTMEGLSTAEMTKEQAATLLELNLIFDAWKLGKTDLNFNSKNKLDMAQITELVNSFKDAGTGVAGQNLITPEFLSAYRDFKMTKILDTYVAPEKAEIVRILMENSEIRQGEAGILEIANAEAKYNQVFSATNSKAEAIQAKEMWTEILNYVGYANGKLIHTPRSTATGSFGGGALPLDNVSSLKNLHNMLPAMAAKTLTKDLYTAHDILDNLIFNSDGVVDITKNPLHGELQRIKAAIDSFATGEGTVQDVGILTQKVVDRFKDKSNADRYIVHDGKKIKVSNILANLQRAITRAEKNSTNSEKAFLTAIDTGTMTGELSLSEAFNRLIDSEMSELRDLQDVVKLLIHGANEKGVGKAATIKFTEELKRKLSQKLGYDANKAPNLDELITAYNRDRSPYAIKKIIGQIQTSMAINDQVNTSTSNSLERQARDFLKRFTMDNHSVSLQAISERFHLQGLLDGEVIDPKFILKAQDGFINKNTNTLNEVLDMARMRINSLAPQGSRAALLEKFDNGGGILLLKHLANLTSRPVAKIYQGQLVFNENKAVTKGLGRDGFFFKASNDYNIKNMYEIERTAVEDGAQKSINSVDLNKVLSEYTQLTESQLQTFKEAGSMDQTDFTLKTHINANNAVYVFPSKGRPILIEANAENLKGVHRWFADWRQTTIDNIDKKILRWSNEGNLVEANKLREIKENFSNSTRRLSTDATVKENLEVKLNAIFWHEALPDMVEATYQNKFRGGGEMFENLKRENLKILKRLNLFEGGNMAPIDRTHIRFAAENLLKRSRSFEDIKTHDAIMDRLNNNVNIVTIADESKDNSVFLLKDVVPEHISARISEIKAKKGKRSSAEEIELLDLEYSLKETNEMIERGQLPSLEASQKNAMTYIDESMARLISAREGIDFDPTQMNGFKPIVYHKDADSGKLVAMKTWLVYSPAKADMMKKTNTHVLTTESAAKVLLGENSLGTNVKMFSPKSRKNWVSELETTLKDAYTSDLGMNVPIEAFSIGTNAKVEKGVVGTMSLVNYQTKEGMRAIIQYQNIEKIMSTVAGMSNDLLNNVRAEVALSMYKHRADQGGIKSFSDAQTMTEGLLLAGIRTDNPILRAGIERVFTSTTLQLIRKPKIDNGISSFLIHDELGKELDNPMYSRVADMKGKTDLRIIIKQGGIAKPAHWGDNPIVDSSEFRLVGRRNGVDITFGKENGELKSVNPYELLDAWESLPQDIISGKKRVVDSKEFLKEVAPIVESIESLIADKTIDSKGKLFDFLENPSNYKVPKNIVKLIKDLNVAISTIELAIPRKSADVIPTRVQKILDRSYGNHSIVNDYDIAVGHQRDFDMDHLYSYDAMPFDALKPQINSVGIQVDYIKQPTKAMDFSPFGETSGKNSFMGESSHEKGVKQTLLEMENKTMAMGAAISMNQPLAWLSSIGFSFNLGGKDGKINMNYSIKDATSIKKAAGMISRVGNMTQAGVDSWQGDLVYTTSEGRNQWKMFTFGKNPADSRSIKDADYEYNPMFDLRSSSRGRDVTTVTENVIHDAFFEVVQTLKRGQAIFGDVRSDGAKVNITPYDIAKNHSAILDMFGPRKNEILFTKLLRRYKKAGNTEAENALYSLFFGGQGTETNIKDQFSVSRIKERVQKGKDLSFINNIINFDKPGSGAKELMKAHGAGVIYESIKDNKIYTHDNTAQYPQKGGGQLSDIMDLTRDLKGRVALLRAIGTIPNDASADLLSNETFSDFANTIAPKLKNIDVRDIAYTTLINEMGRIQGKITDLKKYTRSENDSQITALHDEARNVEATIKLIEMQAVKDFGNNDKAKLNLVTLTSEDDGGFVNYPNIGRKPVSVYEVPKNLDLSDPKTIANLVYGNDANKNGIRFVTEIKPGLSFKGKGSGKYIILQNPLISHYVSDADVINAYSWMRLTNKNDISKIVRPNTAAEYDFLESVSETIEIQTNSHRERSSRIRFQKTRINAMPIYGQEAISEDLNVISKLMRTWAGKGEGAGWTKIDSLSPDKVKAIALQIISPQPIARNYIKTGADKLPHFKVNDKVVGNLMKWLHEFNYMDVMLESLKMHSAIYSSIKNNLSPRDLLKAEQSLDLYNTTDSYFELIESQWKGAGDLVISMMGDKNGVTGNFMADLLKDNNIVKLSRGEEVTLLESQGILSSGRQNSVKYLKDGDLAKKKNYCPQ